MRKLLFAITLTLLMTVTVLADSGVPPVTDAPAPDLSWFDAILIVAIAIPNLLKSRAG